MYFLLLFLKTILLEIWYFLQILHLWGEKIFILKYYKMNSGNFEKINVIYSSSIFELIFIER